MQPQTYEMTGTVKLLGQVQTLGAKGFQKQELVLVVGIGKYPQEVKVEFTQERIPALLGIQPGSKVSVTFDIRGNEYQGKYYVSLNGQTATAQGAAGFTPPGAYPAQPQAPAQGFNPPAPAPGDSGIPF